jgi:hypothetical protein
VVSNVDQVYRLRAKNQLRSERILETLHFRLLTDKIYLFWLVLSAIPNTENDRIEVINDSK